MWSRWGFGGDEQPASICDDMGLTIYSLTDIERVCGNSRAQYVRNKANGGINGQKGTRYEDWLAVFKIAESASEAFEHGVGTFAKQQNATFYGQASCFVDDLVRSRSRKREVVHYQAKNRSSTSWGSGKKSLRRDFTDQKKVCDDKKLQCMLVLVVSNLASSKRLSEGIPPELKGSGSVLYFPYVAKLSGLMRADSSFREALQALTPYESASDSDVVAIGEALLGMWVDAGNRISTLQVMRQLIERPWPLVRPLEPVNKIRPKLATLLDSIPGFNYHLEKGFMHWRYESTDCGCYRYHCGSDGFKTFAKRQIARQPRTFEDLEGELS